MISGVILSAGQSSRLKRPKQLLELGGEPVLRHVVRNASLSHLDQIVLVLGHEAAAIEDAVGDWGQTLAINPGFMSGQSSSLKVGLSAVDPNAEAVIFLLGDQPQVSTAVINAVVDRFRHGDARIVMPSYRGKRANPVLFAREFFPKLARITGDQGARSIVRAHPLDVATVEIDADPPLDIDTEQDYERLRAVWS